VVYTTPAFIEKNPRTVQAIVTAFVRALKLMSSHQADAIANAMPEEYGLGHREVYLRALTASRAMYSPDGRFTREGGETALRVLTAFDPDVRAAKVDLDATYTERFVDKAQAAN